MEFTFSTDLDSITTNGSCDNLEVTIQVYANDEDDASFEIESVFNTDKNELVDVSTLSIKDMQKIEGYAESLAMSKAHEVYYEQLSARGEAMYDAWKEGD